MMKELIFNTIPVNYLNLIEETAVTVKTSNKEIIMATHHNAMQLDPLLLLWRLNGCDALKHAQCSTIWCDASKLFPQIFDTF